MSFEISISDNASFPSVQDMQSVRIPSEFTSFAGFEPIGIDWVGRPALADTFDLSTDLGITAIIVGGLAILSLAGVIWAQPYIMASEFAVKRTIGGIEALEKLGADVSKTLKKTFKF